MSDCVRRYLEDLADPYRTVILLHDVEGLTNPEMAELLGVSVDAVKIRLHRARSAAAAATRFGLVATGGGGKVFDFSIG